MCFENGVTNIQGAAYNGARTVTKMSDIVILTLEFDCLFSAFGS